MTGRSSITARRALFGAMGLAGLTGACLAAESGDNTLTAKTPEPPAGLSHHAYVSRHHPELARYSLYIPPQYLAEPQARFPVVYCLHGGRNDNRSHVDRARIVDQEIRQQRLSPLIMVFPNGGHRTFYLNSADGSRKIETLIVDELIPTIDRTYRTIPHRWGRGIEGLSMGGFGSSRLGLTYPELFCSVVPYAGCGIYRIDRMPEHRKENYRPLLGEDPGRWRAIIGEGLVERNREAVAGRLGIRIVVGEKDPCLEDAAICHGILDDQRIAHEYVVVKDLEHAFPSPEVYLAGIRFHLDWFKKAKALAEK
jgi:esterase/lipase superfamily enzyme